MGFSSKLKLLSVVLAFAACAGPGGKVAEGQLYLSGEQRYDAYFRDVHAIQVWVAQWPDDKKQTRRPLLSILELAADAPDVTIVQATHEKVSYLLKDGGSAKLETFVDDAHVTTAGPAHADPSLFHAIEDTASRELQRAKKMNSMLPRIDELSKLGQSLESQATETFSKGRTPGTASEVRGEIEASFTVLSQTTSKARRSIRECDDFVADLQRAVSAVSEHRERKEEPLPGVKPTPEKPVVKPPKRDIPRPPKPAVPVAKQDDTPKPVPPAPPPPEPPKQDPEVFNP